MRYFAYVQGDKLHCLYKRETEVTLGKDDIVIEVTDLNPMPQEHWYFDPNDSTFSEDPIEIKPCPGESYDYINKEWVLNKNSFLNLVVRPERDKRINDIAWITERHIQEKMLEKEPTLSDNQYIELLKYIDALRNFPAICDVNNLVWPEHPK